MHFERVRWRAQGREILSGTVGDDGVYNNARVRWDVLGDEERHWIVEVLARAARALGNEDDEAELVREAGGYRCAGRGPLTDPQLLAELDDVLQAIHGLLILL